MSRGTAVMATALALALVNLGLATLIVAMIDARSFAPAWVGLVLLLIGGLASVAAVLLWREYLSAAHER